jgi:DNA-binding NarL/FixJ family response regulator
MGSDKIRVLIVDDHVMFAESLARRLNDEGDLEVVGLANSGGQVTEFIESTGADVVLMDYNLPDGNGVAFAALVRDLSPETHVVIITGADDESLMVEAIQVGCAGFITKDRASAEVVRAVRAVAQGEALISPPMLARLLPRLRGDTTETSVSMTERELELLRYFSRGLTNRAISEELHLSVNTVRNYSQVLLAKLGAHSKLEAVSIAIRTRLISVPTT